MKDEIKEILENMKEWSVDGNLYFEINNEKAKLLYDYITNLQEENERLKEIAYNLTTATVCGDIKQIKNTAQYKLEIAQDRIDKAIDYINKYEYQRYCPNPYEKEKYIMREEKEGQELLDILRGNDNE